MEQGPIQGRNIEESQYSKLHERALQIIVENVVARGVLRLMRGLGDAVANMYDRPQFTPKDWYDSYRR